MATFANAKRESTLEEELDKALLEVLTAVMAASILDDEFDRLRLEV